MIEGYATPFAPKIRKAMKEIAATWFTAQNPPSEAMKRTERSYNSYRLAFRVNAVYTVNEVKQLLSERGLTARTVVIHEGDKSIFDLYDRIYDCRIEIPTVVKTKTKTLAPRTLAKALKDSANAAKKFDVVFN